MTQSLEAVAALYASPLLDLVFQAATAHRQHHDPRQVQACTLLSIKTGGCPEDCSYCSQSVHNKTTLDKEKLWDVEDVLAAARRARESGAICSLLVPNGY